jgi:ubiquitin carboxyl-terminal hydrolase 25/28
LPFILIVKRSSGSVAVTTTRLASSYRVLGITPDVHSEGILASLLICHMYIAIDCRFVKAWVTFAYRQQLRCDPSGIPNYLQAVFDISQGPGLEVHEREALAIFINTEKSKDYWMSSDFERAQRQLGFGNDGPLRIEFDEDVDGVFLMGAYKSSFDEIQQSFSGAVTGADMVKNEDERDVALRNLKEAVAIVAQFTGREELVNYVKEQLAKRTLDPVMAYSALGANAEMDDDLILTIFGMRVSHVLHFPTYLAEN